MPDRLRGRAGQARRRRILERDGFACGMCGIAVHGGTAQIDHRTPLAKGGLDRDDNLWALCVPCHDAKTRADFGHAAPIEGKGIARSGRPTSPDHPWNRTQ